METMRLIWDAILDRILRMLSPGITKYFVPPGDFAFIVHPATMKEVYWKYPFMRRFPRIAEWWLCHFWPIRCSRVTGSVGSTVVNGFIITNPLTARQMLRNPKLAERMVVRSAKLARSLGCRVVGLGGMNAWATHDGTSIEKQVPGIDVTTGHAATVGWMIEMMRELIIHREKAQNFSEATVAVVGAAGLMGHPLATFCAEGIQHRGRMIRPKRIILVDVPAKELLLRRLAEQLGSLCAIECQCGEESIRTAIPHADIVIIVTSADKVLIQDPSLFKRGALVIDDTYPANTDEKLAEARPDCALTKVAVNAFHIETNFRMPVPRHSLHTCLAGTITSTYAPDVRGCSDVGIVTSELSRKMVAAGKQLGFVVGSFNGLDGKQVPLATISGRNPRVAKG